MSETRKLAAILFADVVGYSRLMGEDELGAARAVRDRREAVRPIVTSHGGRIVQTIGDRLMLEFPSVVAAVECAIAIQALMAERNAATLEAKHIRYRIGINLGDVLVDGDDIVGDGVNIAARLESICEPGGVFISGAAFDHVRGRIDAHFVDLGEKALKNIARPVRVFAVKPTSRGAALPTPPSPPTTPEPPRLSIVVLPLININGDRELESFADAVTASIGSDLSRNHGFFVIGRNAAFTYKGSHIGLKQVGRELSVRYVLEGSVQRVSDRIRVQVEIDDADTGAHLWADRFDKPYGDLLEMQDEVVARLVNQIIARLMAVDAQRAKRESIADSRGLQLQGSALTNKGSSLESLAEARRLFECALALDPADIWALTGAANVDLFVALSFYPDDRTARLAAAESTLTKALSIAPEHALAHLCLGITLIHTHRALDGIRECERALELNQNLAIAHAHIGFGKIQLGRAQETEAHIQEALRLSPRDVMVYLFFMVAGWAKFCLGRDEEAVAWLRRSLGANRNNPMSHFVLAAALASLGRLPEARSAVTAGLAINPAFTISRMRSGPSTDNPDANAGGERLIESLRSAGAPEE